MVEFNDKLPKWEAEGVEPPKTKQEEGWDIGDRPPAEWFNWLQNRTYKSLEELQEVAIQLGIDIENIDVTEELDALAEELRKEIALRVIKEEGKGLSTNDYTNQDKALVKTVKDKAEKIHTHSANDITETTTKKFVTSTEKSEIAKVKDKANKTYVDEQDLKLQQDVESKYEELNDRVSQHTSDISDKADKTYVDEKDESLMKEIDSVKLSGVESNKILVDALNSKEVQASTSDTIKTNVNKVNDIQTGSKVPLVPTNDLYLENGGTNKAIKLKWSSPKNIVVNGITVTEFKEDVLVRSTTRIPTSIDDGIKIGTFTRDKHKVTPFIDRDVEYDKTYYYAVFSVSTNQLISRNGYGEKIANEGIPISELPVGAKVVDTGSNYYGQPIVWIKLADNHYGINETTLLSEQIICLKAMDAKEPDNSNSDRRSYGNNRYIHSNLRQWLNSSTSNWYSAQHPADAPPNGSGVAYNPYDSEKGFMANLTPELRAAILPTSLQVLKNDRDGGGLESFTDKIFLLSCTEVGLSNETSYDEGAKFDYFKSKSDRVATTTKECVENSDYTNSGLKPNYIWRWWTRTAHSSSSFSPYVRFVYLDGSLNHEYAYYGTRGVRPALNLDSGILVDKPYPDGTYELTL